MLSRLLSFPKAERERERERSQCFTPHQLPFLLLKAFFLSSHDRCHLYVLFYYSLLKRDYLDIYKRAMDVGRRRDEVRSGVVAGSVWESKMKIDEVKGGIKVFNGDQENSEDQSNTSNGVAGTRTRSKRGQVGGALTAAGKRKTWKSDTSEGFEKNPIQISNAKTEFLKNSDQQCKELSVSVDGIKKSPTQLRRLRSEASKEIGAAASDKNERSPVGIRKPRKELLKSASDLGEASVGIEKKSAQLRKVKSECNKGLDASGNAIQLGKAKSESNKALDESDKEIDTPVGVIEKSPVEIENSGSDENCKEFGVCQEMVISSVVVSAESRPLLPSSSSIVNKTLLSSSSSIVNVDAAVVL